MLCFDLLHFAGINLRGAPYIDRRRYLSQCLLPPRICSWCTLSTDAEKLYAASLASGFEGIVAKRKDSTYQPGKRTDAWLKIKATQTAEFVVGGYTKGKGAREPLGSLLLGYWSGSKLHFAGHVGFGPGRPRHRGPGQALSANSSARRRRSSRSRRCNGRPPGSIPSWSSK